MRVLPNTSNDPLNQSRAPMPLKPLADDDFRQKLQDAQDKQDLSSRLSSAQPLRSLSPLEMIPGIKGPVKPLGPLNPPAAPLNALGDPTFKPGNPHGGKSQHDKIEEQARKLVAQTFYGTMFKQMRESPFKSELFSGGRGGQAFTPLLDQHLADHMARSADSKLVRAIARKLEAKSAYQKQASPHRASDNPYSNLRIHVAPGLRA